ncbi:MULTISPECIES: hypothetical protein [Helicobacter]|uniref:Methylenetetrahydrofolate reductase (NAD(P)H) n=1 Tax=Helicobacter typhlonius TaxID=76936 RepID=A0A0S4PYA8_9HELI|nr:MULTISPECIES: hypothetical protein [Helicobacter]TLD78226.1 hypothetical protein LS75_007185 [Helicobacter typhlonius]TLD86879.1 hypothetical protein LS67_007515 [Helicobacter sp. MIT 03-1616]CUU40711.1 FIG00712907: Hypothetical protein [Helicobacter typhlonius]
MGLNGAMMFGIEFLPQDFKGDSSVLRAMCEGARKYLGQRVEYVILPLNPRKKPSVNALVGAQMLSGLEEFRDICFVPTLSGSGYAGAAGREQIISQLLAFAYANFKTLALIGGEGEGFSGVEMIALAREVLGEKPHIIGGSGSLVDFKSKERLVQKLQVGANQIITQPFFSAAEARIFLQEFESIKRAGGYKAQVSLGVFGLFSLQSARAINEAHLGFEVPQEYIESMGGMECLESVLSGADSQYAASMESMGVAGKNYPAKKTALNTQMSKSSTNAENVRNCYERLWQAMREVAREFGASLYLSTPKHNDLRAYGVYI